MIELKKETIKDFKDYASLVDKYKHHKISPSQLQIIGLIAELKENASSYEISKRMGKRSGHITESIKTMLKKGVLKGKVLPLGKSLFDTLELGVEL